MSDPKIPLPTIISTSVILNAIVRGAQSAATELGNGYFAVVQKDFIKANLCVYRFKPQSPIDVLEATQRPVLAEAAVWTIKIDEFDLSHDAKIYDGILPGSKPRYLFLTEEDALSYISAIETMTAALVFKAAAPKPEKSNDE